MAKALGSKKDQIRELAEADLEAFIRLVHPQRILGSIHVELIKWWSREDAKSHQLVLLPRDHQKSALVAYRVAWSITRDPTLRVLYISSTSNLATKQLKFIKDILTSPIYKFYWPEMVNNDEGKRAKWTESEIEVDHPKRKAEAVRDPTIFTAGLTTSITGLHCDIAVLDDVVVKENAYTEDGRTKVQEQFSLLSSIEGAEAKQWVVGTRYHPKDLYDSMGNMVVDVFDRDGELVSSEPLYEIFERRVESIGDGTGEFLWPRQQRTDGKWFGFNAEILARKKAQYLDKVQFRAQYYNDPNSYEGSVINREYFQYYKPEHLRRSDGKWYLRDKKLNVFAAVDFAYSLKKRSDYTAIVVIGMDSDNNYYILEIDRFKTDKISDYFDRILRLHRKWDFRKLRAEVTSAQQVIVNDLKLNYIRTHNLALQIEDFKPTAKEGSKEERVEAVLQPRYANRQIWHYLGGHCQTLEEELVVPNPPHDDVKDCLASVIDMAIPPANRNQGLSYKEAIYKGGMTHSRFGGVI